MYRVSVCYCLAEYRAVTVSEQGQPGLWAAVKPVTLTAVSLSAGCHLPHCLSPHTPDTGEREMQASTDQGTECCYCDHVPEQDLEAC